MDCIKIFFNGILESEVKLEFGTTSIGRSQENDVCIDNSGVSARHALVKQVGKDYVIEDCGSKNGTFVNGQRVTTQQVLKYGDTILIVKHELKLTPWIPVSPSSVQRSDFSKTVDHSGTVEVDLAQIAALSGDEPAPKKDKLTNELILFDRRGTQQKIPLSGQLFTVGKTGDCDLSAKGWFAPAVSAQFKRVGRGYFIYPKKRGQVTINGTGINEPTKLNSGDNLSIRNLSLVYI